MNSCILNQHLKTRDNQILNLQPLFIASTPADEDDNRNDPAVSSPPLNTAESKNNKQTTQTLQDDSTHSEERSSETDCHTTTDDISHLSNSQCLAGNSERNECIVCQCEIITMVLLPCRHACVCSTCFAKLERCPMCREYIYSYFWLEEGSRRRTGTSASRITGSGSFVTSPAVQERRSFKQWIVQLNNTVNNYLGFRWIYSKTFHRSQNIKTYSVFVRSKGKQNRMKL